MEENDHNHHHHNHAWKWALGVVIVFAAFWVGFTCGRFSAFFEGYGYGYGPMMGPWMMHGGYGYPYDGYAVPQGVPPNATATPGQYYYPMYRMMGGYYSPQATSTQ